MSLTPELDRYIDALVASGRYGNASEVVRAGLRLLHAAEPALPLPLAPSVSLPLPTSPRRSAHAPR